jgi:TetR/AcrR family transcriptional regulator, transcriptional repressor for nem operon
LHTERSVSFFMEDTREYIIDEAYKLFLNNSYEAVSISDISKAIGLTKGALYHHFASKEDLFKAVIDKYLNFGENPVTDLDIPLSDYIEALLSQAGLILDSITNQKQRFEPISILSLIIDSMRHYPESVSKKIDLFNSEVDRIKTVLQNAIKRKEIRGDIDVALTASNYFSIIYGVTNNLIQNVNPDQAMVILRAQLFEFYKLLKI